HFKQVHRVYVNVPTEKADAVRLEPIAEAVPLREHLPADESAALANVDVPGHIAVVAALIPTLAPVRRLEPDRSRRRWLDRPQPQVPGAVIAMRTLDLRPTLA